MLSKIRKILYNCKKSKMLLMKIRKNPQYLKKVEIIGRKLKCSTQVERKYIKCSTQVERKYIKSILLK